MIRVNVGSKNPAKVEAVREILVDYGFLNPFELESVSASSDVSEQPTSQEETLSGAMNRAFKSFHGDLGKCDYSFGIESGIYKVSNYGNYFDVCFCVVYDGKKFYPGISSGFVVPPQATNIILNKSINLAQAINEIGLTNKKDIGSEEGLVGIVTSGRITRKEYTKQAIKMALAPLENKHYY